MAAAINGVAGSVGGLVGDGVGGDAVGIDAVGISGIAIAAVAVAVAVGVGEVVEDIAATVFWCLEHGLDLLDGRVEIHAAVILEGCGDVGVLVIAIKDGFGGALEDAGHFPWAEQPRPEGEGRILKECDGTGDHGRGHGGAAFVFHLVAGNGGGDEGTRRKEHAVVGAQALGEGGDAIGTGGDVNGAATPLDIAHGAVLPDGANGQGTGDGGDGDVFAEGVVGVIGEVVVASGGDDGDTEIFEFADQTAEEIEGWVVAAIGTLGVVVGTKRHVDGNDVVFAAVFFDPVEGFQDVAVVEGLIANAQTDQTNTWCDADGGIGRADGAGDVGAVTDVVDEISGVGGEQLPGCTVAVVDEVDIANEVVFEALVAAIDTGIKNGNGEVLVGLGALADEDGCFAVNGAVFGVVAQLGETDQVKGWVVDNGTRRGSVVVGDDGADAATREQGGAT